ncbi:MAG: universal stress protein, partial [Pacificimonas sp.]
LQWGSVQDMIAAEAQEAAEAALSRAADEVVALSGIRPSLVIRTGKAADETAAVLGENPQISALVLGAAPKGQPGTLVSYFSGERAGSLPVVVIIVPGSLGDRAIDALTSSASD